MLHREFVASAVGLFVFFGLNVQWRELSPQGAKGNVIPCKKWLINSLFFNI